MPISAPPGWEFSYRIGKGADKKDIVLKPKNEALACNVVPRRVAKSRRGQSGFKEKDGAIVDVALVAMARSPLRC